jgi:FkbH-like protein
MFVIEKDIHLARALISKREEIARGLIKCISLYPRWKTVVETEEVDTLIARELVVFVDYMAKAFKDGDTDYLSLYAGEKLKQRYDKNIDQELLAKIFARDLADSRQVFCTNIANDVGTQSLSSLENALNYVEMTLTSSAVKRLKVLWIADCIYLDIQAFLLQKIASIKVELDVTLVTTKNPVARRQEIQKLAENNKFDLVFYSPLSYELNLDFAQFQNASAVLKNTFDKQLAKNNAIQDINLTLGCIVANVECDVFVHNTANLVRSENTFKARAKLYFTSKARQQARDAINIQILNLVEQFDQTAFGSVCLIDEMQLVKNVGEWEASQFFHKSPLQHPAKLGALLADVYADIIFVEAYLKPIKLIVADLDNTLWDGVIGEGDVTHYIDRQRTLRHLKEKGLLLSINSKNDVKNVHWDGGLLNDSDFVSKQINWDSKPNNMIRIQKELNLKFPNFLFLDDRAQEREMVQLSIPEILCLDAESTDVWRRLSVWANIAKNPGELDRTQMYLERTAREDFANNTVDTDSLMTQLELKVRIHEARKEELPRVAELINRTNQFNCCDSRTTFREIQNQSQDNKWKIYVADAKDRFGEMGIVSVLVASVTEEIINIDSFVLSCRVFGYGVETAVLKHLVDKHSEFSIRGRIVETSVNEPCRNVFKEHGFVNEDRNLWLLKPKSEISMKPWLTVLD